MRTLNRSLWRLTNGYCVIVLRRRFDITFNLSDRRHSNSDRAATAQLYCGDLPHYYWPGRRLSPVRAHFFCKQLQVENRAYAAEEDLSAMDSAARQPRSPIVRPEPPNAER